MPRPFISLVAFVLGAGTLFAALCLCSSCLVPSPADEPRPVPGSSTTAAAAAKPAAAPPASKPTPEAKAGDAPTVTLAVATAPDGGLRQALETALNAGARRLVIPAGVYHLGVPEHQSGEAWHLRF